MADKVEFVAYRFAKVNSGSHCKNIEIGNDIGKFIC